MKYRGWIVGGSDDPGVDRAELEKLGVVVGTYDGDSRSFEGCEADEQAMGRLDPLWGRFAWAMGPVVGSAS